jgi:hypothetical protein
MSCFLLDSGLALTGASRPKAIASKRRITSGLVSIGPTLEKVHTTNERLKVVAAQDVEPRAGGPAMAEGDPAARWWIGLDRTDQVMAPGPVKRPSR